MSLTLRDVRTLRDALLGDDDWTAAGHAYAAEHDRYYEVIHRVETWYADAPFSGPEVGADEPIRRRFFGEE
jgi:hypothetical protein